MMMICSSGGSTRGSANLPNKHPCTTLSSKSLQSSQFSSLHFFSTTSLPCLRITSSPKLTTDSLKVAASAKPSPLRVIIAGAPASGKGTQCQLITQKYGLVHIAAGDLLRAEVAEGSENGKQAKEYMEKGLLVPDDIVVMMVRDRLSQPDSQQNGWLLDGYPRSSSQATALKKFGFHPNVFILLEVSDDIVVERVVGRRLDPVTGKIYHLKYSPPETEEIAARLTQRFDDTVDRVKLRLRTHRQNVDAVLSMYEDITIKVNGNVSKEDVFAQINNALTKLLD
ncbi:ADK domain-containing protein/ADK_lid domain-containing protein [Cephalotus follicularis]|uniref:adenylate kinase n=1 Tax=Cephalotus follicularis TaxID=3775 RepID=A0A1Q3CIE0_CEPFO|nr:ADK domain-containing protein/ADK_lid domain-containing protein [Cephalotus follicularis]